MKIMQKLFERILTRLFFQQGKIIVSIQTPWKKDFNDIQKTFQLTPTLVARHEAYNLITLARNMQKITGCYMEIGVYRGGTARLIGLNKGNKKFFLCDTFKGLPEPGSGDDKRMKEHMYSGSLDEVKKVMGGIDNVFFVEGYFPQSMIEFDEQIAFVHLDLDLYKSTKETLEFIYPRISKGGIIITHDYSRLVGVKNAFDEFFVDKPEAIIEQSETQAMVVKM